MTDLDAAAQFMAAHARPIDRRRFALLTGSGTAGALVAALDAFRNDDGGVGMLEPDIRTATSQPSPTLYALTLLDEAGVPDAPLVPAALDWLATVTNDDGGVPFVLPDAVAWPMAPWFAAAPPDGSSSLLMTAGLAAAALRLGSDHPWVAGAAAYVWSHLGGVGLGEAYTLRYVAHFLDAVPDRARADAELDVLADRLPEDGVLRVEAGQEGEVLHALEVALRPDHAARRLFPDALIERELAELDGRQLDDGGWDFTWMKWNPTAAWEWRGAVTMEALTTLKAYGRLPEGAGAQA